MIRPLAILAAAAFALPAAAQESPKRPPCAAVSDADLPPALAAWTPRSPLGAAADAAGLDAAVLPIGRGIDAQLKRTVEVTFPVQPAKPGGPVSFSGLYAVEVETAGDYQVSLGASAWIELASGQTLVTSTAHAPGPACSSLKKTVVFPLTPGRYVLEIAGNGAAVLPVMITPRAK